MSCMTLGPKKEDTASQVAWEVAEETKDVTLKPAKARFSKFQNHNMDSDVSSVTGSTSLGFN